MGHNLDYNIFDQVTVAITAPGAGNNLSFPAPGNCRILPVSLIFVLTTDANGANRTVRIEYDDGTNLFYRTANSYVQTASLVRQYCFGSGSMPPFTEATNDQRYGSLSPHVFLLANDTIETDITNIQAGDAITDAVLTYLRWVDPL